MKLTKTLLSTLLIGLLATLLYSAAAVAKGPNHPPVDGIPYTGYGALCGILDMGDYDEEGNIAMLRDAVLLFRVVTDHPIVTGWYTQVLNYDQHLKSGRGTSWGEGVLEPDTYNGTLTEEFAITAKRFVWDIYGTFVGNGDLEGIVVDYVSTPLDDLSLVPDDFCGETPVMALELFEGYIHIVE
jgi:hypothetical protein